MMEDSLSVMAWQKTQVLRSSAKVGLAGKVALHILAIVWFDHHHTVLW